MFQTKIVQKIKTHVACQHIFPENCAFTRWCGKIC